MRKHSNALSLFIFFPIFLLSSPVSAVDLLFNGFNSSDLLLFGNATIDSQILTLTKDTSFTIGRALYPTKILSKHPNTSLVLPFSTSFIFSMAPLKGVLPGHGIVFIFIPFTGIQGSSSAQHLGLFNLTNNGDPNNHVLGIEFDVFMNQEFDDIDDNHVGIDVNSLKSVESHRAGFWPDNSAGGEEAFEEVKLNNGKNYQVWIDYADSVINVTMSPVGKKRPKLPLLNVTLNLSDVFEDEMFIGFTGATGRLVESHRILAWSFSSTNFALSESLITTGLPSFALPGNSIFRSKWFIAVVTSISLFVIVFLAVSALFLIRRKQRMARRRAEMEEWELDYWPHRVSYQEIEAATRGFSDKNVIGIGGNGKVYKGVLAGNEVAVKRISHENDEGMREFLAEISSLGRLKHRNLVGLRGWCKKEKGSLILVYDYMKNGSLDKWVFECDESKMLRYEDRIRILKDVSAGVLYLHEGWEAKVLHRDIKASNVLLDKDMNGKLGDFGLARMHEHGQVASTTRVVGTVGYLAPEVLRRGRASTQTDVYGFGVLILEVMCGRRPIEEGKAPLVEWVQELMVRGEILRAIDHRLGAAGNRFDVEEAEKMLHLGLLCAYPDAGARPTLRQVVKILEGKSSEGYDAESEEMEAYLLQKVKGNKDMWSNLSMRFGSLKHPTFDGIRQSNSSSMSLSWSNTLEEGR